MQKYNKESIQAVISQKYKDEYEVLEYTNSKSGIVIQCNKHHYIFKMRLDHIKDAINKNNILCPVCSKEKKRSEKFEEFVKNANITHHNKYVYHYENFLNMSTKTTITCPVHGDFIQTPVNHLHFKQGCPKCYHESRTGKYKHSKEEIITMCKQTHGNLYNYDHIIYQGMKNKILNILCPKHGYFDQIAYDHIRGFKCEKCKFENQTMTKDEFIAKSQEIHNSFYIYEPDKILYVNNNTKVPIICPKHGEFWQRPGYHLMGGGCPKCNESKLEKEIANILKINKINNITYYSTKWLGRQTIDFFLPDHNIAIECQGLQHFEPVKYFGGEDEYEKTVARDLKKRKLCDENGVKLLYYSNLGINYPYKVYENTDDLLKEIITD